MTGRSEEMRKVLPDPKNPKIVNGGFEESTLIEGQADGWHYQRRGTLKQDSAPDGKQYICFENNEASRTAHALQAAAIDGSAIGELAFTCRVKTKDIHQGAHAGELPGCVIHFFDGKRIPIGTVMIGPWVADQEWTRISKTVPVPGAAREMIFQVGLNGATGSVCIDGMQIQGGPRVGK